MPEIKQINENTVSIDGVVYTKESAPQPQQVPEGYALVPIEPTDEMIEAGCALYDSSLRQRYKAMLEVAPKVKP